MELLRNLGQVAEACIAISEVNAAQQQPALDPEAKGIARSLTLCALGKGIERCTRLLQRNDPRLTDADHVALLKLVEWFGQHIVQVAGT